MSPLPSSPRGMYFEEFEQGQRITTVGRTVTESDIVNFAGLSGDFTQIHTDAVYSLSSPAGQRVAHGLLILSIASGLVFQTGLMEGTVVYFREIDEWKFIKPIFIGDTIHVDTEILETKELRRTGTGLVTIQLDVQNQEDQTVMKGIWKALFAMRPAAS
jgi:3-hydroxybutyryl-CoA dehydratase